jgi:hypothetical protein
MDRQDRTCQRRISALSRDLKRAYLYLGAGLARRLQALVIRRSRAPGKSPSKCALSTQNYRHPATNPFATRRDWHRAGRTG